MQLRKAVFAGSWYPDHPADCEKEIRAFMAEGFRWPDPQGPFNGGIVPHAGWYYSGNIACNVIQRLAKEAEVDVIALFGMHLHSGSANYLMVQGAWETPLGALPIHEMLARQLARRFSFHIETAENHSRDNTIELQLPFIKYFFPNVAIVPMGVPPTSASLKIGEQVVDLAGESGLRIKIIGSTDLTHYGPNYGFVEKGSGTAAVQWVREQNDRQVIDAMRAMDPQTVIDQSLAHHNACCGGAAAAALAAGKRMGSERAEIINYATSYDKSPGSSFVGYVGVLF
jgi:AmmeMemoRadiSam system protein B